MKKTDIVFFTQRKPNLGGIICNQLFFIIICLKDVYCKIYMHIIYSFIYNIQYHIERSKY